MLLISIWVWIQSNSVYNQEEHERGKQLGMSELTEPLTFDPREEAVAVPPLPRASEGERRERELEPGSGVAAIVPQVQCTHRMATD